MASQSNEYRHGTTSRVINPLHRESDHSQPVSRSRESRAPLPRSYTPLWRCFTAQGNLRLFNIKLHRLKSVLKEGNGKLQET
jgi:hypothetical protein